MSMHGKMLYNMQKFPSKEMYMPVFQMTKIDIFERGTVFYYSLIAMVGVIGIGLTCSLFGQVNDVNAGHTFNSIYSLSSNVEYQAWLV